MFVKDMAYQAAPILDPAILGEFRNSFLVRDPAATLSSLAWRWPDFTDDEAGWDALDRAADLVEQTGQEMVVLDAERLCEDPPRVVSRWCDAMDLDYREDALTWKPAADRAATGKLWGTGTPPRRSRPASAEPGDPPPPPTPDEPRLLEAYERAVPVYERLWPSRSEAHPSMSPRSTRGLL